MRNKYKTAFNKMEFVEKKMCRKTANTIFRLNEVLSFYQKLDIDIFVDIPVIVAHKYKAKFLAALTDATPNEFETRSNKIKWLASINNAMIDLMWALNKDISKHNDGKAIFLQGRVFRNLNHASDETKAYIIEGHHKMLSHIRCLK